MSSWARPVAAIIGISVAIDLLMVVAGMGPDVILVAVIGVFVGVGVWFTIELVGAAPGSTGPSTATTEPPTPRTNRRVMRLRAGLANGRPDGVSLTNLRSNLVGLIDDQLECAHHIDRAADPDAARAVLGDELTAFVEDPDSARVLTEPRSLDHILTLIERI